MERSKFKLYFSIILYLLILYVDRIFNGAGLLAETSVVDVTFLRASFASTPSSPLHENARLTNS